MNIKDLANLDVKDLQNIDYTALLSELKKKPDIIIEVLSIIVTIVLCFYIYGTNKEAAKNFYAELKDLEQKSKIYDQFLEAQKIKADLQSALPAPLTESEIIEIITNSANHYNIKIESFSPAAKADNPAYKSLTLTLELKANSYKDLWSFIYRLEDKYQTIRIDTWSVGKKNIQQDIRRRRQLRNAPKVTKDDPSTLNSTLTLSAINFKND